MRVALLVLLLAASGTTVVAADARYRLQLEPVVEAGRLTVAPALRGPANRRVRYEMVSTKSGGAGKSTTRQSGRVDLGPEGSATLSTLRLSLGPQDRYAVTLTVFDGETVVAEQSLSYPP
jgi:hypothetical protein